MHSYYSWIKYALDMLIVFATRNKSHSKNANIGLYMKFEDIKTQMLFLLNKGSAKIN